MKRKYSLVVAILMLIAVFCGSATTAFALEPDPDPVTACQAKAVSISEIQIRFSGTKKADGYAIYRLAANDSQTASEIADIKQQQVYTVDALRPGTQYDFYIRSYILKGDEKIYSKPSEVFSAKTWAVPAAPKGVEVGSDSYGAMTVKWEPVPNASGYDVYTALQENGVGMGIRAARSGKKNETAIKNLKPGQRYFVCVKAYTEYGGEKVYSPASETASCIIEKRPDPVVGVSVRAPSATSLAVTWQKAQGAKQYAVYLAEGKTEEYALAAMLKKAETSAKISGLKPGTSYRIRVKAFYEEGKNRIYGASSQTVSAKTLTLSQDRPAKPKNITAQALSAKSIKVGWSQVKGAQGYIVYVSSKSDSGYKQIAKVKANYQSAVIKNSLDTAKKYYFKVKAYKKVGEEILLSQASDAKAGKTMSLAEQNAVWKPNPKKPMVALTFDDGPGPATKTILDLLVKYQGRATFCVVGSRLNSTANQKLLRRAADIGCEIACHTWDHKNLTALGQKAIKEQLEKTNAKVKKLTGKRVTVLRPPVWSGKQRCERGSKEGEDDHCKLVDRYTGLEDAKCGCDISCDYEGGKGWCNYSLP